MQKDRDILEIVTFLFKNCLQSNGKLPNDQTGINIYLRNFGFKQEIINKAFEWLAELNQKNFIQEPSKDSIHIFTKDEDLRLSVECRRFLIFLERNEILNSKTRELVIHHLLRLNQRTIEVTDIKWVTLIVLFNQPKERAALISLEQMLLGGSIVA